MRPVGFRLAASLWGPVYLWVSKLSGGAGVGLPPEGLSYYDEYSTNRQEVAEAFGVNTFTYGSMGGPEELSQVIAEEETALPLHTIDPEILGASFESLRQTLQRADPSMRAAFMRHFSHAIARLRNPYLGLPHKAPEDHSKPDAQKRVSELAGKLLGVLRAAEMSGAAENAMSGPLLSPFSFLMREAEDVLFDIARTEDAMAMIAALRELAPLRMRGLSHLAGHAQSGVLEPVRLGLLSRTRELDEALLKAQHNPQQVLNTYTEEISAEMLQSERQLAFLEHARQHPPVFVPPPIQLRDPSTSSSKTRIFGRLVMLAVIALFAYMVVQSARKHLTLEVLPPQKKQAILATGQVFEWEYTERVAPSAPPYESLIPTYPREPPPRYEDVMDMS